MKSLTLQSARMSRFPSEGFCVTREGAVLYVS